MYEKEMYIFEIKNKKTVNDLIKNVCIFFGIIKTIKVIVIYCLYEPFIFFLSCDCIPTCTGIALFVG